MERKLFLGVSATLCCQPSTFQKPQLPSASPLLYSYLQLGRPPFVALIIEAVKSLKLRCMLFRTLKPLQLESVAQSTHEYLGQRSTNHRRHAREMYCSLIQVAPCLP